MNYCFGVDIGGTTIKMGLFQFNGEVIDKWEIKTRVENEGAAILPDIAASVKEKMEKYKLEKENVLGIGVGVPAPVSENGIVNGSANLGWKYKEVKHELEEYTDINVKVGNDANVAALGEMWKGGGLGNKNMVMVTLGTGVGGGIIIDGKILGGAHGAGGEIGHICVNYEEEEKCGCGNRGCLEQYASATGITRLANMRLKKDDNPSKLRETEVSAKTVFDAVKEGDALAIEVAEEFGKYLGYALANIAVLTDPSVIVIGGGVSKAGEILLTFVEKYFRQRVFFANESVKFALAQLGNDAGICGAAKLVLN
ncbi:ROK family glucokinase [Lachnoclostridium sp. An181]|uniref:ROK family glucokinase n=1 Tax=Lachnoclostridium sp. An181 TaxID=1965575 RepID=UPI000B3A90EF|nr:ROK family glucokinase [Lachnoclostridium sp. An181]OUP49686.1 glucokinase [Lachnoclostridium sp. An181]